MYRRSYACYCPYKKPYCQLRWFWSYFIRGQSTASISSADWAGERGLSGSSQRWGISTANWVIKLGKLQYNWGQLVQTIKLPRKCGQICGENITHCNFQVDVWKRKGKANCGILSTIVIQQIMLKLVCVSRFIKGKTAAQSDTASKKPSWALG